MKDKIVQGIIYFFLSPFLILHKLPKYQRGYDPRVGLWLVDLH